MGLASALKEDVVGRGYLCAFGAFKCDQLGSFEIGLSMKACLGLYNQVLTVTDKAYTIGQGLFTVRGRIADFVVTYLCTLEAPPVCCAAQLVKSAKNSVYGSPGKYFW